MARVKALFAKPWIWSFVGAFLVWVAAVAFTGGQGAGGMIVAGLSLAVFTVIVGIVLAYINRGKAGGFVESHYTFLIRTFWIGLLYALISVVLMMLVIGFVLMLAVAVWFIARCILGIQALQRGEPVRNPQSWLLGQ